VNEEKLWIIGSLIIVLGISLLSVFMLSNEELYFLSQLSHYTAGFLILGLIVLVFGFLFTMICLDRCEKVDNTTKTRIVMIAVTVFFIILIGYLMVINQVWIVEALIIGSFAFFVTFTFTSYNVLFATLLIFGIFVLPFVINELGILDNYPDEPPDNFDVEKGQSIEGAEEQIDRLFGFLKSRFGSIKKIKNYTLPIGITLTILGGCLMVLPSLFIIDSPLTWDSKTETWIIEEYYGFIRGQLLLIGILLLVIGIIFIIRYIRRNSHSTDNEIPKTVSIEAGPRVR
jgi:hypothetical protein